MSWIEKALLISILMYLFVLIVDPFKNKTVRHYLPVIAFAFMVSHSLYDTVTWQLVPIYFLTAMIFMSSLIAISLSKSSRKKPELVGYDNRKKLIVVTTVALLLSSIAIWAFPLYEMPIPSGLYDIGTVTYDFTETERIEIYGDFKGEERRIKVQVWYPADSTEGLERVPWLEDGRIVARTLASEMNAPKFILDHTKDILSHAYSGAKMSASNETFPIIVLSHGWTGFRNLHTDLAETLASNGFIVFGIDHTFGSQITVFNDGTTMKLDHEALPDRATTPAFIDYARALVDTYAYDVSYVLDQLSGFNDGLYSPVFKDRLNLDKIGLLGHSTGGGADVAVATSDDRVKAILGMDAWVEPVEDDLLTKGLKIPALFLRSGEWETGINNDSLFKLINSSQVPIELYQIDGTKHIDFTMAYMYSRLTRYIGFTGDVERKTFANIQNRFILDFFSIALKDVEGIQLSDISEVWPIVKLIKSQ